MVTSEPQSQYYVDPSINANTGSGTVGDPWGDLQHALDNITRDSTNGDQINIKAGTDEVLAANIDLTSYGTPSASVPLYFRGYTSAAGDGGIGSIDLGSYQVMNNGMISMVDMHFKNGSHAQAIYPGAYMHIINCKFTGFTGSYPLRTSTYVKVIGCTFEDNASSTRNLFCSNYNMVSSCRFKDTPAAEHVYLGLGGKIHNCLFEHNSTSSADYCIQVGSVGTAVIGCTFYSSVAAQGHGIYCANSNQYGIFIANNLFEGFSGTGGSGIDINGLTHAYLYNNKFYNCTSNIAGSGGYVVDEDNSSLASSPFTNAGSGDFTVDTQVKAAGFPAYVGGSQITTTPTYIDVGAAQRQEPAGGGSTVIIARPKRLL